MLLQTSPSSCVVEKQTSWWIKSDRFCMSRTESILPGSLSHACSLKGSICLVLSSEAWSTLKDMKLWQSSFISLGLNKINNLVAHFEIVPLFLVLSIAASRTFFANGSSAAEDATLLWVQEKVEAVKRKRGSVSKIILTPSNMRDSIHKHPCCIWKFWLSG